MFNQQGLLLGLIYPLSNLKVLLLHIELFNRFLDLRLHFNQTISRLFLAFLYQINVRILDL
jgi:hypothetical protein